MARQAFTMRRPSIWSGIGLLAALGVVAAAAVTLQAAADNNKAVPGRRTDQDALKAYAPLVLISHLMIFWILINSKSSKHELE